MRLRDRRTLNVALDPTNPIYETGTDEDRAKARAEWHRQRFAGQVLSSELPEIPSDSIAPHRFGIVEDTSTGRLFRVRHDELPDLEYANATAYYVNASGTPVLLEDPPSGSPWSVQALRQQQAEREARRNMPRPKPSYLP